MTGTLRSLSSEGLTRVKRRIGEIASGVAAANRCHATVSSLMPD